MSPKAFQTLVYREAAKHYRDLPWRHTKDPYHIWTSELMLQQTQVSRVIPKYQEWLQKFPTIESLASADTATVLKTWKGLGYNSRAIRFKAGAAQVLEQYEGKVPKNHKELVGLPGVGTYTAGAIRAFSWNLFTPIIETNIRTVFIHHLVPKEIVSDRELLALVDQYSDHENSRDWYTALMDYGTYLKSQGIQTNARVQGYKKQSPFKGSVREARALILDAVTEGPIRDLPAHPRQQQALESLVKEGLVEVKEGYTHLVS